MAKKKKEKKQNWKQNWKDLGASLDLLVLWHAGMWARSEDDIVSAKHRTLQFAYQDARERMAEISGEKEKSDGPLQF
jgi:hypothetical protein